MAATAARSSATVTDLALAAKAAARRLATIDPATKDAALLAIADALEARTPEILEANARDLEAGREAGLSSALMDRLALDEARIARDRRRHAGDRRAARSGRRGRRRRPPGQRARVPQGSSPARRDRGRLRGAPERDDRRRRAVPEVRQRGAAARLLVGRALERRAGADRRARPRRARGCPQGALALVAGGGREELTELAQLEGIVDLIIPRGGEGLKKAISAVARVPVIYAAAGNCHVYVDATADLAMAERIIVNAKVQRPGVCNAAETLLVHRDVAAAFLPSALAALRERGVELRGDARVRRARPVRRAGLRVRLGRGVPRPGPRRARRRLLRGRPSSTSTSTAPATPRRS